MIELKAPAQLEHLRAAGRIVREILSATRAAAAPGILPVDLDGLARDILASHGADSPFLHYRPDPSLPPFPGVLCISVNDAVLHGIPGRTPLADGDLVSIDCGARLNGWVGDAADSFVVGTADPADQVQIDTAYRALAAGIDAARVGNKIGDISAAIGAIGRAGGYGINTDFGGHGVGRTMHEEPSIPNEGPAGRGYPLKPGLVIAIEPWFLGGGRDRYRTDRDRWTLRSTDGSRCTHVEQTVAITADGPVILTG